MSLGKAIGRNMRLSLETSSAGNSNKDGKSSRKHSPMNNLSPDRMLKCYSDENRNSLIEPPVQIDLSPTSVCEVTTTEITEQKTKKTSLAMNTFRSLVRATVVSNTMKTTSSNSQDDHLDDGNKDEKIPRKKKTSLTKYRIRKRTRRTKDICNEGASLWKPMDNCCWKSAAGKLVSLGEISISDLCEVELSALKHICLNSLQETLECQISLPKENRVAVRTRWKKRGLFLRQKSKEKSNHNDKEQKPRNPVFSVDLYQVIENDKAVDKAHEIAMEKLGAVTEDSTDTLLKDVEDSPKSSSDDNDSVYLDRRNSDPAVLDRTYSFSTRKEYENRKTPEYMMNAYRLTIDTLKEEDEEDMLNTRRRSRLIEALTLSSTTASSTCVLDKESEFTPPVPQLPKVISQTVDYITTQALNTAGIFRTGGSKKRVRQMREDYDNGYSSVITEDSNPHDVAALFKEFLRSLPDPLLTRELYTPYLKAARQKDQSSTEMILTDLVRLLPSANRDTLFMTLQCLRKVADNALDREDSHGNIILGNKMDTKNLATLMAPNILHRCKTYKTTTAFQADIINPEDNKAAIDVVYCMIQLNENLFRIPAHTHDQILRLLLDEDPEVVDYVLRKKAAKTSYTEDASTVPAEITFRQLPSGKRPSSAGSRMMCGQDEVTFHKSYSFNQGPYKPFVIRRKDGSDSRPTSVRSDQTDRSSVRRSGLGTPPNSNQNKRKSSRENGDLNYCGNSPRDSGVIMSTTPPFQRNSLIRSSRDGTKMSPPSSSIVYRKHSRDRESRDSAYESGMKEMFPSRKSNPPISLHLPTEFDDDDFSQTEHHQEDLMNLQNRHSPSSPSSSRNSKYLNDVLSEPSFLSIQNNVKKQRKISLPVLSTISKDFINPKSPTKHKSVDCSLIGDEYSCDVVITPEVSSKDWQVDNPEWNINSQLPSQETTL